MKPTYDQLRNAAAHALTMNDCLGFDSLREAFGAVIAHDDWQSRWEIERTSDLVALIQWRRAYYAARVKPTN